MAIQTRGIKLSELSSMTQAEKRNRTNDLIQAAMNPSQNQLEEQRNELDSHIRSLESRYKITSSEMKRQLIAGQINESTELCHWLMLLSLRGRFEQKFGSSRTQPT